MNWANELLGRNATCISTMYNYVSLKGLYHSKVFIQVCLQIEPESYEWGLSARSVDLK